MFLDIGWSEMAIILAVALVVIGPKDLPRVARQIGKWSTKARAMAREFQRSIDDMAREAELQDIKAEIDKVSRTNIGAEFERAVDPDGDLRRAIEPPRPADLDFDPDEPARSRAGAASTAGNATTTADSAAAATAAANAGEPPAIPVGAPPAATPSLPGPAGVGVASRTPEPATTESDKA